MKQDSEIVNIVGFIVGLILIGGLLWFSPYFDMIVTNWKMTLGL